MNRCASSEKRTPAESWDGFNALALLTDALTAHRRARENIAIKELQDEIAKESVDPDCMA